MAGYLRCPGCKKKIVDESLDVIVCPDCGQQFDRTTPPTARSRVVHPATALIVIACLGMGVQLLGGIASVTTQDDDAMEERPAGMDQETYQAYQRGRDTAPCFMCCSTLFVYPLIIAGAVGMRQARNYGLAVTASVVALMPCGLAFFLSMPVGIWALVVLLDPKVKATFK
ncbi:MAG: hypothetical protein HQ567_32940 [Candidatus Nealsonbacteria bacterium]|nr:hypothetical protein [Candidatus Nealsonbacteria bacterium]